MSGATNVTYTNIIIGACSSFKLDSTELGGTSGGVIAEKKRTFTDIEVDQLYGTAKKAIKKDEYTVKTTLAEGTLQNLAYAWDGQAPTVSAGTTTYNIGVDTAVTERQLTFVGPGVPVGGVSKTRTVTFHRVVSVVATQVGMSKDKETLYALELQCLPDTSQPAGQEYGSIVEA